MPTLTKETWGRLSENVKNSLVNSIDQTVIWASSIPKSIFKPLGEKPTIRKFANGKWIVTNTCKYWCDRFEWDIAIHWCDLQNKASASTDSGVE